MVCMVVLVETVRFVEEEDVFRVRALARILGIAHF